MILHNVMWESRPLPKIARKALRRSQREGPFLLYEMPARVRPPDADSRCVDSPRCPPILPSDAASRAALRPEQACPHPPDSPHSAPVTACDCGVRPICKRLCRQELKERHAGKPLSSSGASLYADGRSKTGRRQRFFESPLDHLRPRGFSFR